MKRLGIATNETSEATDVSTDSTDDKTDAINEETSATNSLIDAQKELKKIAEELPETTEAEIAAKNAKIESIDEEIKRLNDLGKATKEKTKTVKDSNKLEVDGIDKKIRGLEVARALEAAITEETSEERIKKESDLLDKVGQLKVNKARKVAEKEAEDFTKGIKDETKRETAKINFINEAVTQQEQENKLAKAELDQETQAIIDEQELEALKEKEGIKEAIKTAAINTVDQIGDQALENESRRIEEGLSREVDALNLKREAGEISEEEFNKKRLELDKQAFKQRKNLAQKQNIVDFAVAVGKTLATYGFTPAGAAALIPLGVQAVTQAGIIATQKFSKGGVIHGASHAFGGVDLGNNQEGEGGEAIINKVSTRKHLPLLSAINQDGGGVPLGGIASPSLGALSKFGNGGITNNVTNQGSALDMEELRQAFSDSINTIKVQNVASETTEVANRVQSIEDSASF